MASSLYFSNTSFHLSPARAAGESCSTHVIQTPSPGFSFNCAERSPSTAATATPKYVCERACGSVPPPGEPAAQRPQGREDKTTVNRIRRSKTSYLQSDRRLKTAATPDWIENLLSMDETGSSKSRGSVHVGRRIHCSQSPLAPCSNVVVLLGPHQLLQRAGKLRAEGEARGRGDQQVDSLRPHVRINIMFQHIGDRLSSGGIILKAPKSGQRLHPNARAWIVLRHIHQGVAHVFTGFVLQNFY